MTSRAIIALSLLLLGACASEEAAPVDAGKTSQQATPPGEAPGDCDGVWRAADAELGTMWLEVKDDEDCVIIGADGQRFVFEADSEDGGLVGRIEVGNPGLKILFGPEATDEVEGTINFAMGFAEARFERKGEALDATFWRRSRPQETKKTIRMTRPPEGATMPQGP
jgi:hypothetical protein